MRATKMLVLGLVLVGALVFAGIGGTFATWSDSEISYGNYIETGSLELKVNGQDDEPWGSGVGPVFEVANATVCVWYNCTVELWNAGDVDAVAYLEIKNLDGPDCLVEFTDVRVWYDDELVETGTVSELAGEEIELGDLPAGATEEVKIELHATEGSCCNDRFDYDLQFDVLGSWADSETSQGNYFGLGRHPGVLLPTGVSIQMYVSGNWPPMYDSFYYRVKNNKINSVSPGVMFYYNTIEAASGDIVVVQDNTANWRAFTVHQDQAYLYDTALNRVKIGTASQVGNKYLVTFGSSGLTPGATYYIGIKFSPKDMKGQPIPFHGATQTEYFFSTEIGGVPQLGSDGSITLLPKP